MTEEKIAHALDISVSTFQIAEKKDDALRQCLLKGRALASSQVLKTAFSMATSGKCPAMTIFWLKCREGFKDTSYIEHTGKGGGPIETSKETEEEKAKRKARLKKKLENLKSIDE